MELNQLVYFQTVAKTEHITKAAQQLHISQPSLSKTITRLEEDLGVSLFERQANSVRLNDCGRAFLRRVDNILLELQDARKELSELSTGDFGQIYFAVTLPEMLSDLIETYLTEHPNVRMHQIQATAEQMQGMLQNREIDFALSTVPLTGQNIQWTPITTEKIGVSISKDNPLSARETLQLKDLTSERFIVNSNVDQQKAAQPFFESEGLHQNIFFEGTRPEVIGRLISKNYGIGFISKQRFQIMANSETDAQSCENIVYCDVEPPIYRITGIAVLQDHYLSPAARDFFQFLVTNVPGVVHAT